MISRASLRSTKTPATALKATAGTRKVRIRTALAVFDPVADTTVAIRAASTMLLASWLSSWAVHSRTKLRLRKTLPAPDRSWQLMSCGSSRWVTPAPPAPCSRWPV